MEFIASLFGIELPPVVIVAAFHLLSSEHDDDADSGKSNREQTNQIAPPPQAAVAASSSSDNNNGSDNKIENRQPTTAATAMRTKRSTPIKTSSHAGFQYRTNIQFFLFPSKATRMMKFTSLIVALQLLLFTTIDDGINTVLAQSDGSCDMQIWVFDTLANCNAPQAPNATGVITPDGQCNTVVTNTSSLDASYNLLPDNYRALCTSNGTIHFLESGCIDGQCSSSSISGDTATCDLDISSEASLYSRFDDPEYIVQDVEAYICLRLNGTGITVTFVIFGNCSAPGCSVITTATPTPQPSLPATDAPTDPTATATDPPTPAPATPKPVPPPTPAPVAATTSAPATRRPTTLAPASASPVTQVPIAAGEPTPAPTMSKAPVIVLPITPPPVTPAPSLANTPTTTTVGPTNSPVAGGGGGGGPTAPPSTTPTAPTSAAAPTTAPAVAAAPTDSPAGNTSMNNNRIAVALKLSPMLALLDGARLALWENATKAEIQQTAEDDGVVVSQISISAIMQRLVDGGRNRNERMTRRDLQTAGAEQSLRIDFDLAMRYSFKSSSPLPDRSLSEIFVAAFDTVSERSRYLKRLADLDPIFDPVLIVAVLEDSGVGVGGDSPNGLAGGEPTSGGGEPTSGGGGASLIAGIVVGVVLVAVVLGGLLVYKKRKHGEFGGKPSTAAKIKDGETPSSHGGNCYPIGENGQSQRYTNEILVDPSADDVSTLGGSVLGGLNLDEGGGNPNGEDEPTASVNLDYDYGRARYRTEADDRTRSQTETSAPTTFTNYSKLGMNGESVFADDISFEEQYADDDDEDDTHHNNREESGIASRVKPFEVRAPPGKLGMVIDTPNGGVPVVRAIKPDSVLTGRVMIGDRLISVDHQDVTSMSALEVSSLISLKQNQMRMLVFCRLDLPNA